MSWIEPRTLCGACQPFARRRTFWTTYAVLGCAEAVSQLCTCSSPVLGQQNCAEVALGLGIWRAAGKAALFTSTAGADLVSPTRWHAAFEAATR